MSGLVGTPKDDAEPGRTRHVLPVAEDVDIDALIDGLIGQFGGRLLNWSLTHGEALYVTVQEDAAARTAAARKARAKADELAVADVARAGVETARFRARPVED
jgi:hypothetical protein